ncbi:MAG: ABC transporter permease [Planctomycetota bacterium]
MSLRTAWLTLRLGLKSLFLHKLRSSLTVLGILIGVTAVIWLVAMGEGVSQQAQEQIKSLGATSIIVRSVKPTTASTPRSGGGFFVSYGLLRSDFEKIQTSIPAIVQAVPMREIIRSIRYDDRAMDARTVGCTPEYPQLNQIEMAQGRFLTDHDLAKSDNVCVIASGTAEQLFPFQNAIGRSIQIDNNFYVVVGVTKNRMPSAAIGGSLESQDYNQDVYIPLSTFRWRIGDQILTTRSGSREGEIVELSQITVKVMSLEDVDSTADMVREILERAHPAKDFAITVPKELLRQAEIMRMLFTMLLVLISGISLVVGGIGIMNIMLATVTERTREIGIRRALGARRVHILWQFLTETLVLTLTGGVLGVLLGLLCGPVVSVIQYLGANLYPTMYQTLPDSIKNLEPQVAGWSIGVSLMIAVLVGLFFGIYPARRAAYMDPIEALRHE